MGFLALTRFDAGKGRDPKHRVSLVCHGVDEWSETAYADLPFEIHEAVFSSSCRSLVYFMGKGGKIVVCNLKTRHWIVFPVPDSLSNLSSEELIELDGCGLGYDSDSKDYKLFRTIMKHVDKEERAGEVVVGYEYVRSEKYTELYSFKSGLWKTIETPKADIVYPCAVHIEGSCYWTAIIRPDCVGLENDSLCEDDDDDEHILAFDIATEKFSHFPFPQMITADGDHFKVVEYRGSLGALIYDGPVDWTCSTPLRINIFVRRNDTWENELNLTLNDVERPLGFGESRDGPVIFLERNCSVETSELMVYYLNTQVSKGLGIRERRACMIATLFDFRSTRIPGSTRMTFVDDKVPSSEGVEEMKTSGMSKNRPRKKMKSGRKSH